MPHDETDDQDPLRVRKIELLERVARRLTFTTSAPMILSPRNGEVHRPDHFIVAGVHGDEETEEPVHIELSVDGLGDYTNTAYVNNFSWGPTGMSSFDDSVLTNPSHAGEVTAYIPPDTASEGARVTDLRFTATPEVRVGNFIVESGTATGNRKVTVAVEADPAGGFPGSTFIRVKLEKDGVVAYDETKQPAVANWSQVFPQVLVGLYTVLVTYRDGAANTFRTSQVRNVT